MGKSKLKKLFFSISIKKNKLIAITNDIILYLIS